MFTRLLKLLSEVGTPASQEARKSHRPARKRLQPARNKLQPARKQFQSVGKNSGGGSWMHMLYPSHYAPDTWLLTSRIIDPPWVLGLPGLPWALPGFPWAFPLAPGPLGAWSRALGPGAAKIIRQLTQPIQQLKKTTDSINHQTNGGHIGPIGLILGQI